MEGEGDPRAGTSGALPYRWERPDPATSGEPGGGTPDLMSELRARTEEAQAAAGGRGTTPDASSDVVVPVPLVLLRRLASALSEARLLLAQRHGGTGAQAGRTDAAASDVEKARMIVLNMALNGASREEAEHYLSRNFVLDDPGAIVADAYERVPEILSRPSGSGTGADVDAGPEDDREPA